MEFKEFEPRFKSDKTRFKFSAGFKFGHRSIKLIAIRRNKILLNAINKVKLVALK